MVVNVQSEEPGAGKLHAGICAGRPVTGVPTAMPLIETED